MPRVTARWWSQGLLTTVSARRASERAAAAASHPSHPWAADLPPHPSARGNPRGRGGRRAVVKYCVWGDVWRQQALPKSL